MIAGLEEISDGELWIDGELCNYYEPGERGLSMVFQNYALYPNMTVYGNLAYALKIRKIPKKEIDEKVHKVAENIRNRAFAGQKAGGALRGTEAEGGNRKCHYPKTKSFSHG